MRRSLYFRCLLFEIFGQVLLYQFQLFYFLLKGNVLSICWKGSENIGKILLISFNDNEEEIIESVLAALGTGRNIYCDENNIKPLKIHYGDIVILLDKRELFRKQEKIDLSFIEFEILHLLMRSPGRVFSKEQIYDIIWN